MTDEINELPNLEHDDIQMRVRRVSNYLFESELAKEYGGFSPTDEESDQYCEDVAVLTRWVNTPYFFG
jgi:hypothetical protein